MTPLTRASAAIVALFLVGGTGAAQSPSLTLEGKVKQPRSWSLDDLKKLPPQHITVSYQTDHGIATASFTGALLWSLITGAGGINDSGKSPELRHAIRITAKDDYVIVTSTGEIAPDFGDKAAIVAYERDGKPLDDFRIVMPGDKHGGRNVRDVVSIKIE